MHPVEILQHYRQDDPQLIENIDKLRQLHEQHRSGWPDWCYVPLSLLLREKTDWPNDYTEQLRIINSAIASMAVVTWRVTKGIYRFDPDLYQEIVATPITGELPVDALLALPEWCVYLETPALVVADLPVSGAFVFLDYDWQTNDAILCVVLTIDIDASEPAFSCSTIPLERHKSLEQILDDFFKRAQEEAGDSDEQIQRSKSEAQVIYGHILPMLLYICAANADIADTQGHRPQLPQPVKTKRGPKIFAPQQPRIWDVGVRVGAALRAYRPSSQPYEPQGGTHRSPRPHVRRAHWHGYWTGPRSGQRQFVLRWLHPMLVGGKETIPTIHDVKRLSDAP